MFNNVKLKVLCGAAIIGATTVLSTPAFASDAMLDLLKILHNKGSISSEEYNLLRNAALADEEKVTSLESDVAKVADLEKEVEKSSWAQKVKIKGDVRLRYQTQNTDPGNDRSRGRVRLRAGIIGNPMDKLETGAGLASGGSDPRSTNQTFDSTFDSPDIRLDYAYAQYEFTDYFTGIAGKFKRKDYLWAPTDLMWDGDINPEGVSGHFKFKNDMGTTFVNTGIWILEENSSSDDDPYMLFGQLGHKWKSGDMFGTLAGTYYGYQDINTVGALTNSAGTNTDFEFDALALSGELGKKNIFGKGTKASVFFDYIKNTETDTAEDTGFAVGLKVAPAKKWEFKYIYADLETNAVPDAFPDSDRFNGDTGISGHEFALKYKLFKKVTLGLDYYYAKDEKVSPKTDQSVLQADVVIKF